MVQKHQVPQRKSEVLFADVRQVGQPFVALLSSLAVSGKIHIYG